MKKQKIKQENLIMNEITVKKKRYVVSEELEDIANEVIKLKNMDYPANIKYLLVYPYINKTTAGRCIKTSNETKLLGNCDYIIEMSGDLWDKLDDDRRKILMWHELLHIHIIQNDKTGEWDLKLRKHDLEEFTTIVKLHGVDWLDEIKTLFLSVYDLDSVENFSL